MAEFLDATRTFELAKLNNPDGATLPDGSYGGLLQSTFGQGLVETAKWEYSQIQTSQNGAGGGIRTHAMPGWKPGAFPLGDARLKNGPGSGS